MNSRELLKWLKEKGVTIRDAKGSHVKIYYEDKQSVLPMHSKDLTKGVITAILRPLDLKEAFEDRNKLFKSSDE